MPAAILFRAKLARPTRSTRAGSCATTDDRAQISQPPPPSYGSLRNPITGVPRARTLKLFSNMARRNSFSWLALQKARREVRKFLSPPLLWLAPQSDHESAACAETEAFFQYGPPQSFFELSWLALQKARAREVAQRLMTGRKFLSPPLLWLAPQSDHGSAARAETEASFQNGKKNARGKLAQR